MMLISGGDELLMLLTCHTVSKAGLQGDKSSAAEEEPLSDKLLILLVPSSDCSQPQGDLISVLSCSV